MSSDLPPPDAGERQTSPRSADGPNYRRRRALVGGSALVALIVAAVAAFVVVRDDGDQSDELGPTWDAVAVIDPATGSITVLDDTGDEVSVIDGAGRVKEVHGRGDRLALVGPAQLALVRVGEEDPLVVPLDRTRTATRLPTNRSLTFVVAPASGGNVVVVDGESGARLDVGAIAGQSSPLLFADSVRSDPDGRRFAVGDGRNFQTIVVGFSSDEATFYPGVPVALTDDLVVTSTNVGNRAELGFFDSAGERLGTTPTERIVGGVIDEARFVYVTVNGEVLSASADQDEPDELGAVTVPAGDQVRWAMPALDGRRLVLAGDRFWALVDLEGTTLHQNTFTAEREALAPWFTWRCAPAGGTGSFQALIDLEAGEVVADLDNADVTAVSTDGCGVEVVRDDTRSLVSTAGRFELPATVRTATLSPDGRAAVLVTTAGRGRLVNVDDDTRTPGDTVDLGTVRGTVVFVDR